MRAFQEGKSCLLSPGAPDSPVHHRTLSGADFLSYLAKPTVGILGAVGAPDSPVPLLAVGSATCHAWIARPTVGPADRWLTGQSGVPPNSPVNYSRTSPVNSRERPLRSSQPGAPDTVRCTTGHCPVPRPKQPLGCTQPTLLFPYLAKPTVADSEPLAHWTLSGAHRTVRCPLLAVGSATCPTQIAPPTVGPADRWLTGQSGAHRTVR